MCHQGLAPVKTAAAPAVPMRASNGPRQCQGRSQPKPPTAQQVVPVSRPEREVFDKTKLCKFYTRGLCRRGETCRFAHGRAQLQPQPDLYRTEFCYDYIRLGRCEAGSRCNFAHSREELREGAGSLRNANKPEDTVLATASDVRQQLELLGQRAAELQAQLWAMQMARGTCSLAPQQAVEEPLATMSRQSTEDCDFSVEGFSRQSSADSYMYEDDLEFDACVEFSLSVRNTFIDAEPVVRQHSVLRRSKSAPAGPHQ